MTREDRVDSYYSLYPFAHFVYFVPLDKFGVYAGLGGGLLIVSYKFNDGRDYSKNFLVGSAIVGINLLDMIDISYAFRTNFDGRNHKVAVGYTYRFK